MLSYEHQIGDDSFLVRYEARTRSKQIDITWEGLIASDAEGAIRYSFRGVAGNAFLYGRIGLNVLYPLSCVGRPFRGEGPGGATAGHFPVHIAPQECVEGVYLGLFPPVTRLVIETADADELLTVFKGEVFEMEDQRNWTDASFKMYSTPLSLGLTHEARPGQIFFQEVRLSVHSPGASGPGGTTPRRQLRPRVITTLASVELGEALEFRLPALGLGLPHDLTVPTKRERQYLRALSLDHVRTDVDMRASDALERLDAAAGYARSLNTDLELALHLPPDSEVSLTPLAGVPLARVLVFADDRATTPGQLVAGVREQLRDLGNNSPVGGGTDTLFADLNSERPDSRSMDVVCYPLNPQMHASDDASVMETAPILGLTVESAHTWCEGRPIAVTPVTLRMRSNPRSTSPLQVLGDVLASDADHRQATLFCAAWTVASVASLAYAGTASVTYFETVGSRGILGPRLEAHPVDPLHTHELTLSPPTMRLQR